MEPTTLDPTMLRQIRAVQGSDEPDFVSTLIDTFVESSTGELDILRQALQAGDVSTFRRTVHGLKGSSYGIGALHLAHLCEALEADEHVPLAALAEAHLGRIEAEYARLKVALERERRG